jgi:hypothetical protein
MYQALLVGGIERQGDLAEQSDQALRRQVAFPLERGAQLLPVEELHDERVAAVLGRPKIQDIHDVDGCKLRAHLKLAFEALYRNFIFRHLWV